MRLRWKSCRWRLLHQRQRLLCPSNNRLAVLHRTVFSHHRIGRALPTPAAWLLWPHHHLRPTTLLNYNFNHQLPTTAPFYRPDDILAHLTTIENNIPDTPAIDPEQNYFRALTVEEFQLLSQQQTTPIPELNYNLPVHDLPSDLRMPHYDSLPLHLRLSEAVNFYYYNLTSLHLTTQYTNIQLHIPSEVLLRFVSAGQLINFCRDYVSHMISIKDEHRLPTRQLHQRLHRITYNLDQITTTFNLSNNFIWNYHMPLYLPELLNYFDQPQQLQDHHYKSINTMLHKSVTYYGITLLTATNLSTQYKLLHHNYLTTTGQALAPPECDYNHIHYQPLCRLGLPHQPSPELPSPTLD